MPVSKCSHTPTPNTIVGYCKCEVDSCMKCVTALQEEAKQKRKRRLVEDSRAMHLPVLCNNNYNNVVIQHTTWCKCKVHCTVCTNTGNRDNEITSMDITGMLC
jgi:hypothetical protein